MDRYSRKLRRYIEKHHAPDNTLRFRFELIGKLKMTNSQFIQALTDLQTRELIKYQLTSSHHNDLRLGGEIVILKSLVTRKEDVFRKWFRNMYDLAKWAITTALAIIAIIISIIALSK